MYEDEHLESDYEDRMSQLDMLENYDDLDDSDEPDLLVLTDNDDGTYTHIEYDTTWTYTDYTEQPCEFGCDCDIDAIDTEHIEPDNCGECSMPVYGAHYVCMDDGTDIRHTYCVNII